MPTVGSLGRRRLQRCRRLRDVGVEQPGSGQFHGVAPGEFVDDPQEGPGVGSRTRCPLVVSSQDVEKGRVPDLNPEGVEGQSAPAVHGIEVEELIDPDSLGRSGFRVE